MTDTVQIIGVPMDLGQSQRGVDMGPFAIRYAGLSSRINELGYEVSDSGNIFVPVRDAVHENKLFSEIATACGLVYEAGKKAISEGHMPIFLGGDHSVSIGSIGGVSHDCPVGVIWIDAHGDFNTPEISKSGNVHGMSLAVLAGKGRSELVNIGRPGAKLKSNNIILVGVRSLDTGERNFLMDNNVEVFTMRDIDEQGINYVIRKALSCLEHVKKIHVSLDVDSIDPAMAPGVGTPAAGGLSYREAHLMMEIISDSGKLSSMDIVEINPVMDIQNRTAELAVEMTVSALGKKIM